MSTRALVGSAAGGLIGLDVTPLAAPRTGIGRYTFELLAALWRLGPDAAFVPLGNRGLAGGLLPSEGAKAALTGPRLASRAAWMFGVLPWWLARAGFDLFHGTSYYAPMSGAVPTVVTFHDMSVFAGPEWHPSARVLRARTVLGRVARHASAIIAPSRFAEREIGRWLDVPPDRVHVVPGAGAASFSVPPSVDVARAVAARYSLAPGFFLSVGTVEPRKNLERVVEAVARLRQGGDPARLVVAGRLGWGYRPIVERVARLGLDDAIRFVDYVPDDDLRALMACARALVYPSMYEGFGLPVVEAMAAGLPVITSRDGALLEVAGDAALLVDPLDTDAIVAALHRAGRDEALLEQLRRSGVERASRFSWDASARATLAVYQAVLQSRGAPS